MIQSGSTERDPFAGEEQRWQALLRRDPRADGAFFYGVKTTGIYCRPVCASKRPKRANVLFFDSVAQAEQAGFRPCKRCRPNSPTAETPQRRAILQACRLIERAAQGPTLAELAAAVGFSPAYFQRLFKKSVGVTPKQYALEVRRRRLQQVLPQSATVTEAIQRAGFDSSTRFYEDAAGVLGMQPAAYRQGGKGMTIRYTINQGVLGWVLIAASERGICAIELDDAPQALAQRLRERFPAAELVADDPTLADWSAQVLASLETPGAALDLPLDVQGTAFQRQVWQALQQIPPGSTVSYGELATQIAKPGAARAVAGACAANKIAVLIPCHRVVRGDGGLGGYRWGMARKRALLAREQVQQGGEE